MNRDLCPAQSQFPPFLFADTTNAALESHHEMNTSNSNSPRIDEPKNQSILIVDDVGMVRRTLRGILQNNGYTIVGDVEDGDEAVDFCARHKPDLVLMDIEMKRMSGLDAARRIKSARPESKIIMVTQASNPSLVVESIRAGASNFIHKPFSEIQIIRAVEKALAS